MYYNNKDFEGFYVRYKADALSQNISAQEFCIRKMCYVGREWIMAVLLYPRLQGHALLIWSCDVGSMGTNSLKKMIISVPFLECKF